MNYMVGFILMLSGGKEKETFWFFDGILQEKVSTGPRFGTFDGLANLYKPDFPLLMLYKDIFNSLFEEHLPDLFQHFQDQGYPIEIQTVQWFQTCFLYSFPMGLCIRIWDNILAKGTRFVFNIGLAVLKLLKDDLITLGMDTINQYFSELNENEQHL